MVALERSDNHAAEHGFRLGDFLHLCAVAQRDLLVEDLLNSVLRFLLPLALPDGLPETPNLKRECTGGLL